jgi:hypothetical protein
MLDKSFTIFQTNAISRDTIDWARLKEQVYQKAASAKSYQDVVALFSYLFKQLGDHHVTLRLQDRTYAWRPERPVYRDQVVRKAINTYPSVRVLIIRDGVGYVLLPGNRDFSGKHINMDTQAIWDAAWLVNTARIDKWI